MTWSFAVTVIRLRWPRMRPLGVGARCCRLPSPPRRSARTSAVGSSTTATPARDWSSSPRRPVRYIRDRLGPIVFATEPRPIFRDLSATGVAGRFEDHVLDALAVAAAQRVEADEKTRLAYDLLGASFSVDEPDARLMLLMMVVETLIDPKPRAERSSAMSSG